MHVVAHLSHYVVFYTTLPYLFIHSSQLEFRNLDFFIPCRSLSRKLYSRFETRKSDIIRPGYELSNACGGSCPSQPCISHYVTFSFTPRSSSLGIWIFSSHVVPYIIRFDLRFDTWNPISYNHAMRFLLHVVAHVSHYVIIYTTLLYLFIHSSQLEFRNFGFFIPCHSLHRKLWFKIWNSKIPY